MEVDRFFYLFLDEIKRNKELAKYYKFNDSDKRFLFRKSYFCQRLEYISSKISNVDLEVLDLGCGYGTTALFLALNGIKVHGITLEFYTKIIPDRIKYWEKFGDTSSFTWSYENIFDFPFKKSSYDCIIAQDTLHHLEPCKEAINVVSRLLRESGKFIVVEENGDNLVLRLMTYKLRGRKRIIKLYDEVLKKHILFGNENIRGLNKWSKLLEKSNLKIHKDSISFIRYYFPYKFRKIGYDETIKLESKIENEFIHKYFYFGLNFTASKN